MGKLFLPEFPDDMPVELRTWIEDLTRLLNLGVYAPRLFNSAPALADMEEGELAGGIGTAAGGENELFIKVSSTTIARFTHDGTIT